MHSIHSLSAGLRALCISAILAACAASAQAAPAEWLEDWQSAQEVMRREGRPGLLYFYNLNTRPCKRMEEETFSDTAVQSLMNSYVLVRLQPHLQPELTADFNLIKVPTVIFLAPDGRRLDQAVGFKGPDLFTSYLNRGLEETGWTGSAAPDGGFAGEGSALDLLSPRAGAIAATFRIRSPMASRASVIGDFNDWREDAVIPFRPAGDAWEVTVYLDEGTYEYKYFLDGQYFVDPNNPYRKPNPYGSDNSVLIIGNPRYLNPAIQARPANPNLYLVTWGYYDESAREVGIGGTFNEWQVIPMFKNPALRGEWGVSYELTPGNYEYKFIIDGEWSSDPYNFRFEDVSRNQNNIFSVP